MLKLTLKNCSSIRYLPRHPQYLKVEKNIRKKLRESQISTPSMEILFLVPIIPLQAVNLL
jgi:hypothetical protein